MPPILTLHAWGFNNHSLSLSMGDPNIFSPPLGRLAIAGTKAG
ncbi:MAG TPA: hypothetical protein VN944_07510 [Nitrospiria bacterium]|nr:hypothetical protein [Nitrospiria bacterium]